MSKQLIVITILSFSIFFFSQLKSCQTNCLIHLNRARDVWMEKKRMREVHADSFKDHKKVEEHRMSYDLYEPEWICETEVRIGKEIGDGGKFVCDPQHLSTLKDCLVYSIGSNYDDSFELAVLKYAPNCEVHAFDPTLNMTKFEQEVGANGYQIHLLGLGHYERKLGNGMVYTLDVLMDKLGHTGRRIDLFKVDCETCEYDSFPLVFELVRNRKVQINQIQIEMHGTNFEAIQRFFGQADAANYRIFHKERNHWGCQGYHCVEYALIHSEEAERSFLGSHC
jgi:hypothetical protein